MPTTYRERERLYGAMVRDAFKRCGFPPSWGMAIAKHESTFTPTKVNDTGGDATLGNAWGLCQMTYDTAKSLGYKGVAQGLLDPLCNCALAAKLFSVNAQKLEKAGIEADFRNLAAAYNCGVGHVIANTIPQRTLTEYLPFVIPYQRDFQTYDGEILT